MNKTFIAGIVAGFILSGLVATTDSVAIQWSSAVGGNDHYRNENIQYSGTSDIDNAYAQSKHFNAMRGHLATLTLREENNYSWGNFRANEYWLGGYQIDKDAELARNLAWISGEEWNWANRDLPAEPNGQGDDNHIQFYSYNGTGNDKTGRVERSGNTLSNTLSIVQNLTNRHLLPTKRQTARCRANLAMKDGNSLH